MSVYCLWNWLVKKEMLSNSILNIAVWDVLWIIHCSRYGIFFPLEILQLNDPDKILCHLGFIISLCFEVLVVRYRIGFAPSLYSHSHMEVHTSMYDGEEACRHPVVVCAGRGRRVVVAGRSVAWACSGRGAAICVRVSSSVNHL